MKNLNKYQQLYKDDRFYREIFIDEVYKMVFDKKKDVVLDIGALAGEFSFWIEGNTVYALEPQKECFEELTANIKEFGFKNVLPFRLAISGQNGERSLETNTRGGGYLSKVGEVVQTVSLASFIKENNIDKVDILKIDVEGAENEIFTASDFKEVADKITCIIGEHLTGLRGLFAEYGFIKVSEENSNLLFER